jgi:cytoskeletal protein RodZ
LDSALGLLLLVLYIVAILSLSALITYAVVRIFPTERKPKNPDKDESPPSSSLDGAGRLFRRSKRATT